MKNWWSNLKCDCDQQGTEDGICDPTNGRCICKEGFGGPRCDKEVVILESTWDPIDFTNTPKAIDPPTNPIVSDYDFTVNVELKVQTKRYPTWPMKVNLQIQNKGKDVLEIKSFN